MEKYDDETNADLSFLAASAFAVEKPNIVLIMED